MYIYIYTEKERETNKHTLLVIRKFRDCNYNITLKLC